MEKTLVKKLKAGDKIKLFKGGECTYTVIDENPPQYANSIRVRGEEITFPLYKYKYAYKL